MHHAWNFLLMDCVVPGAGGEWRRGKNISMTRKIAQEGAEQSGLRFRTGHNTHCVLNTFTFYR